MSQAPVDEGFLQQAIDLARQSVEVGGGPFAALVVRNGQVIGKGHNRVTLDCDPTAHAEVQAIRDACRSSRYHHLDGATIYVSCQPCPMCMAAAYWAHITRIVYAATDEEAAAAGFDDRLIAEELALPLSQRKTVVEQLRLDSAEEVFRLWREKADRIEY